MIIESTERFYDHEVRSGRVATYPTNFLRRVLEAENRPLPFWRRLLRWLRRIG